MTRKEKPSLIIPLDSYQKIISYARAVDTEITGFADVDYNKETDSFTVGKVYLIEQVAHSAEVEMEAEDIAEFTYKLIKKGAKQLPRLWWHSHVNMSAFFSATDHSTIENFNNDTYLVALVVNKSQELEACVKVFEPIEFLIEDIPVIIDYSAKKVSKAIEQEVAKKVNKPKPKEIVSVQNEGYYPWGRTYDYRQKEDKGTDFHKVSEVLPTQPKLYLPKNSRSFTHWLPKDLTDLLERVTKDNLVYQWNDRYNAYVFINEETGKVWVDNWGTLDDAEPETVNALIEGYKFEEPEQEADTPAWLKEANDDTLPIDYN